ncbi:MAG TPA: hypothetical protein DCZ94_16835 [Lentisphaeria bacterium]|nr:MAG: hypothetical protein A2X48_16695 [Lentisphaerae bacterium GWF2_49_21]HBC88615.1 hypothetical protein [Lentisphaeria bacterium]
MIAEHFQWNFPGGVVGLLATVLGMLLLTGLSYRYTLRQMPQIPKLLLSALRGAFLLLLLFCLCAPSSVKEEKIREDAKTKLAVVFDESASMKINGSKTGSRIDESIRSFRESVLPQLKNCELKYYAFAEGLRPLKIPEEISPANVDAAPLSTAFYQNLSTWSKQFAADGVQAVICMTDGIDTGGESIDLAAEALNNGAPPHLFVPAAMPLKSKESFEFIRVEAPPAVRAGSSVPVTLVAKYAGLEATQPLEVSIKEGDKVLWQEKMAHSSSSGAGRTVSCELPIKDKGPHVFEATASYGGKKAASVIWSVYGVSKERTKVLLFMGSLDFGARYLKSAFERSEHAEIAVRFAPDVLGSKTGVPSKIKAQFVSPEELAEYDVAILMNLRRHQITPEMEAQLKYYISGGGSVLFIIANTEAASEYVNSPVEKFLPVSFVDPNTGNSGQLDGKTRSFLDKMSRYRANLAMEKNVQAARGSMDVPPMTRLLATAAGAESPLFEYARFEGKFNAKMLPLFEDCALVEKAKPGATVLAVHPEFSTPENGPRVLLAVQPFGHGRSAILATDPLWRWRLSISSKSKDFDRFWENFVSWLGGGHMRQPHWRLASSLVPANTPVPIYFFIPPGTVKFEEISFSSERNGKQQALILSPSGKPGEYKGEVALTPGSRCILKAFKGKELIAESSLAGGEAPALREMAILKPDLAGLKYLASLNNGLCADNLSGLKLAGWLPEPGEQLLKKDERPLWHEAWIFAALIGFLCVEFCVRRFYRLV